ncbi:hypothetical protein [Dactylosporangium sp. NPDC000521]|uniref:hypothetical protein n=1 Tax=Dactylosporangium sp. NPDC000521 TaxID=3363975 RepID=UPI0036AB0B5A
MTSGYIIAGLLLLLVILGFALLASDGDVAEAYDRITELEREKRQLALDEAAARKDAAALREELERAREALRWQAQDASADKPVEYLPVWTTGAPPEAIDEEFDGIMRQNFLDGGEAS